MKKEYLDELKLLFPSDGKLEDYCKALEFYYMGKYAESQTIMSKMIGYRDCDKILLSGERGLLAQLNDSKKGDIVTFGNYNRNPITWRVIDKSESEVLLITQFGIECKKFNEKNENTIWKKSSIYIWLNSMFLKNSFTDFEQSMIFEKMYSNSDYSEGKVFLLSVDEANKYMSQKERICVPTNEAVANGAKKYENGACAWWLRNLVAENKKAVIVYDNGNILTEGDALNVGNAVRPAIWIKLDQDR